MVNVVIDLNLLFHKWAHYLAYKHNGFLYKKQDKVVLIQNVMYSLYNDINKYKGYANRIILCMDSNKKSWRNQVDIGDKQDYKGTRKKREIKFDRDTLHQCINEFSEIMSNKGLIMLSYDHAEGDDLIAVSVGLLFSNGESSIIVTSDSDIRMLIRTEDKKFVYVYDSDKEKKLHYINERLDSSTGLSSTIQEVNSDLDDFGGIFSLDKDEIIEKPTFENLLSRIYQDHVEMNPHEIIFSKMLAGDTGDNVPSCLYYRKLKVNGEPHKNEVSFTEPKALIVYDKLKKFLGQKGRDIDTYSFFKSVYDKKDWRDVISKMVIKEAGIHQDDKLVDQISENIRRNLKLTFLNTAVYDDNFKNGIITYVKQEIFDPNKLQVHRDVIANGFKYEFLDDTPYAMGSDNAKDYDDKSLRY